MFDDMIHRAHADGTFGEIYTYENTTAQSIPSGSTLTKINSWTNNGHSKNVTTDYANGKMTVSKSGIYYFTATYAYESGTNNVVFEVAVFVNGVQQNNLYIHHKVSVAGDVVAMSLTGSINANSGDDVDMRVKHDYASAVDLTIVHANMNIAYIGKE